MKKFLAVFLSISMLNFSLCHVGCAKTSFISSPVSKEYRIEKQNKGNSVVVKGEEIPAIVINNENNARAEAKATANSGGAGGLSKLILLAIKIGAAYFGMKYVCNMLKSGVKGLTELMTNLGDKLGNVFQQNVKQTSINEQEQEQFISESAKDFTEDNGWLSKIGHELTGFTKSVLRQASVMHVVNWLTSLVGGAKYI